MRMRIAVFATALLCLAPAPSNAAGNDYYWSDGRKIALRSDPTTMVVVYGESTPLASRLARGATLAGGARVAAGDARLAVLEGVPHAELAPLDRLVSLGVDPSQVSWASRGYSFEDGSALRPTDRICFGLAPGRTVDDVARMAGGRAVLARSRMGTPMLRMRDPAGDVVALANELYESGLVGFAHPDFIANLAFADETPGAHFGAGAASRERAGLDRMIIPIDDPPGGGGPTIPDYYPQQWYLNNTGQGGGTPNMDIDAPEAWAITQGSASTIVAVLDDGVEVHEDIPGYRFVPGYTPTTGGDGSPVTGARHGECVAGIVGAANNGYGVTGVAPLTSLMSINIDFNNLAVTDQDIADGINWAWQHGAAVLNNSWGYSTPYDWVDVVKNAIDEALLNGRGGRGCVVVFSAGNNYPGGYWWCPGFVSFPALVPGVVCVSAITKTGTISSYSSRGKRIDVAAFGGQLDIYSTDRMGSPGYVADNYYANFEGTSAAAPQVSGVAALALALHPTWTGQQVVRQILKSTIDMGQAGRDTLFGFGRLNAYRAVHDDYPLTPDPTIAQALANALPGQTVTVTAGARRIDTDLVVPENVTLHVNSGVELWFAADKGIHVYGVLEVTGSSVGDVRLSGIDGAWSGITFHDRLIDPGEPTVIGDLFGCTLDHASGPITADFDAPVNAGDRPTIFVTNCLIQNSSFTGDAGIAISNCDVWIYGATVIGSYNSANGIRLSGCNSEISESLVEFCGAGNGITINGLPQDGWVEVHDSQIRENAYNQIFAMNTWGGYGVIVDGNSIWTGIYNEPSAMGVVAYQGYAELAANAIDNQTVGVGAIHLSTVRTGSYSGWNYGPDDIRGNQIGAEAYYISSMTLPTNNYLGNTLYDLASWNRSNLSATNSWCGNPGGVPVTSPDGSSTLTWASPVPNYIPGAPLRLPIFFGAQRTPAGPYRSGSARELRARALSARQPGQLPAPVVEAIASTGDPAIDAWARWQATRSAEAVAEIELLARHDDAVGLEAIEMLRLVYSSQGRTEEARAAAHAVRERAPGTEADMAALAFLAQPGHGGAVQREAARAYRRELASRFGPTLPPGLLAAIPDRPIAQAPPPGATAAPPLALSLAWTPNPVVASSLIRFTLPEAGAVKLELFDVQGRQVATILEGTRTAGLHTVTLDPSPLHSGVYFCRLTTATGVANRKVLVLD